MIMSAWVAYAVTSENETVQLTVGALTAKQAKLFIRAEYHPRVLKKVWGIQKLRCEPKDRGVYEVVHVRG